MNILTIAEPSGFSQNWDGAICMADEFEGIGSHRDIVICAPEIPGSDLPTRVLDAAGDTPVIMGTYKGMYCHDKRIAATVVHCDMSHDERVVNPHSIPLALDQPDHPTHSTPQHVFIGGRKDRDFRLADEACVRNKIRGVYISDKLSPTWEYYSAMTIRDKVPLRDYTRTISCSKVCIVPLQPGLHPHGHSDVVRAILAGKPVLTTRGASCDKYIQHKETGYLADPTPESYADGLEFILDNYRYMCQNVKGHRSRYTYTSYNRSLRALCEKVVGA